MKLPFSRFHGTLFLFKATVLLFLTSCGIENYIYLAPVTSLSQEVSAISVTLPNAEQPDDYFTGYKIYYKIYLSFTSLTSIITSSDFGNINPVMSSNYAQIAPYMTSDSIISMNFDDFFKNPNTLNFYPLQLEGVDDITSFLTTPNNSFKLEKDSNNLYMTISETKYPLKRSAGSENNVFLYTESITGDDVVPRDDYNTAYVLFFIFAYGVDEYGSPIFSRPTMLGAFELPSDQQ